jgi:predicted dehydrogenase
VTSGTEPGHERLRVVVVGAGLMGQNWLRMLHDNQDARVVGIVDLDVELARTAAVAAGLDPDALVIGAAVTEVAQSSGAEAVVNVTVPRAHLPVTLEALDVGLPVLCEKPLAPTVAEALVMAAASAVAGRLLVTSQNRRHYTSLTSFREAVDEVAPVALLTTEFAREAHFPGFRERMPHPLLVDMAVHAFDVSRYLLRQDPVSVWCETFNPSWSWFDGDTAANVVFEFEGGTRYRYTGTWTTRGMDTSWNGTWRASGANGTATWDGERGVVIERADPAGSVPGTGASAITSTGLTTPIPDGASQEAAPEEIAGALAEFVVAVRTGIAPESEAHSNVSSLAMVEAATRSAESGDRVRIQDVFTEALARAIEISPRDDITAALRSWSPGVTTQQLREREKERA